MKYLFVLFGLMLFLITTINAQIKTTNIDWNSIKNGDGKINLTLIKSWGEDVNNDAEMFGMIGDVCIDKENNYYICDSQKGEVAVFDKNFKLLKRIGRGGRGPGDFGFPESIRIDASGNLLVSENGNKRVQIIPKEGKPRILSPTNVYFSRMSIDNKNRVILQRNLFANENAKLFLYNYNGEEIGRIGTMIQSKDEFGRPDFAESQFDFCCDKEGNVYMCNRYGEPKIEKYSPEGKLLMKINYKLGSLPQPPPMPTSNKPEVIRAGGFGIDVDEEGNIYILALKRDLNEKDIEYLPFTKATVQAASSGTKGDPAIENVAAKKQKNKFDFYQLIVFDKNGNLKGSKSFDYLAGKIRIFNNVLFVVDNANYVLKQYRISL